MKKAEDILQWAVNTFGDKVALASSFGAEDVVLIDMLCKITSTPNIFTLDTGRLNQETYSLIDAVRDKYGINIRIMFPDADEVEQMVSEEGMNLFYNNF